MEKKSSSNKFLKLIIILISCILIFFLIKPFAHQVKSFFQHTARNTVKVISKTVGTPMQMDQYGNVNVLLVGYGGAEHGGGYLADTMIVASRNPKL